MYRVYTVHGRILNDIDRFLECLAISFECVCNIISYRLIEFRPTGCYSRYCHLTVYLVICSIVGDLQYMVRRVCFAMINYDIMCYNRTQVPDPTGHARCVRVYQVCSE